MRITYNGAPLVTGTAVTDALLHYVTHVAGMAAAVAVDVPVLESTGSVRSHTLILSGATQLEVSELGAASAEAEEGAEDELTRFPVPNFPAVGGQAFALAAADLENDAPFLDEDPLDLLNDSPPPR